MAPACGAFDGRKKMKKELVFLAIGGLAAALAMPALAAESLTVVSWGGAYQDSVRKAFFEPFMKESGDKIVDFVFHLSRQCSSCPKISINS
jgi:spermidine/putrescine-binding protein